MRKPNKAKLTAERVRQLPAPKSGEVTVWDTEVNGLGVRCLPSGVKSYIVTYRSEGGRAGVARRVTLGKVNGLRLSDAREAALDIRAKVMRGEDPVLDIREKRIKTRQPELTLLDALDRYDDDLHRRGVTGRSKIQSSLRNYLLGHIKDLPLAQIDRRLVVEAIEQLERQQLPGAAKALRSYSSTFLKWCADKGYIEANPLQGYRAPRSTRVQRVARPGRNLTDEELGIVWHACSGTLVNRSYGQLVRMLILTGQRRTETARMRWEDIVEGGSVWKIPATETKNGLVHEVPLPNLAQQLISQVPKQLGCEWVFSTNGKSPISGWSKLGKKLDEAITQLNIGEELSRWTLHDLRRTFRTGLSRLGVEQDIAEIMMNHRPETLRSIYDREPRMDARFQAAERWALHVGAMIDPDARENVVTMEGRGR